MQPGKSPRRAWLASIVAAAAIGALASALSPTGALAPASALAALAPPSDGALSPRLAELAKPALRTALPAEQAQALSLANEGPGSLVRDGNRVLVEVRFDHGAAASVGDLRQAGARVVNVSPQYQTVTVAAKPDELRALNGVPRVAGAREVLTPVTSASTCPSGTVVSEGVQQLHAGEAEYEEGGETKDEARSKFEVDGEGVTVGILSDSFNRATEAADGSGSIATKAPKDVEDGDLPGSHGELPGSENPCGYAGDVTVLDGDPYTEGEDEGRAMAQIVHDVAPGANLAFATAFTPDMLGFAENIEKLAEPGGPEADVIADDVVYFEEPFFQEGPVANAVRNVTEEGVTYLSAAGNENLLDPSGHEIASWEARQFRDAGVCPPAVVALSQEVEAEGFSLNPSHCMDFNPGAQVDKTFGIKVAPHGLLSIDLQWAEPWQGVGTDIDAFLLNSTGGLIGGSAEDNVNGSQMPFEFVQWENESSSTRTVQLVLNRYSGGLPRLKLALVENGYGVSGTEYPQSSGTDVVGPTVFGHSGSSDAISVGAVPFDDGSTVEPYSSRGPVTHYFGPTGGATPAPPLGSPQVLAKPDVVATDCGVTSFFALQEGASWRFCGTSAAAPHAAGVAALMLARESASPSQVRNALQAGAVSVSPLSQHAACAEGAGLVEAVGAIEALESPGEPFESACETPAPEVSPDEARAPGDWGSESPPVPPSPSASPTPTPQATPVAPPAPPKTSFRKRPPRLILTRRHSVKWAFRFGSDQGGVTFLCKVDRGRFHRCNAWFVRRYRLGRHVLRVKARRNSDGAADATPAVYRFRVKRVRRGLIKRRHARHHHRG